MDSIERIVYRMMHIHCYRTAKFVHLFLRLFASRYLKFFYLLCANSNTYLAGSRIQTFSLFRINLVTRDPYIMFPCPANLPTPAPLLTTVESHAHMDILQAFSLELQPKYCFGVVFSFFPNKTNHLMSSQSNVSSMIY